MTKKNYEAIAKTVRERLNTLEEPHHSFFINGLANIMEADNPRFDRARFLAACRGEDATDSAGRKVRYSHRSHPESALLDSENCPRCPR